MVIEEGGEVGIGTVGPNSKLEVAGTIHSTSGGIKFQDDTVQTTAAGGGSTLFSSNSYTTLPNGLIIQWGGQNQDILNLDLINSLF